MKYLRYFDTEEERKEFLDSDSYVAPHVSYAEDTKEVDYYTNVKITMKASADTTVDVFYTVDDFKVLKGNETITLKANEAKTTLINRPYIFSPGVVKYDYANGGGVSANTAVTEITIDGTVENGEYLFRACTSLTSLDVSNLDTSKMTNMYQMFDGCGGLTTLDVSSFNTSKVTNMYQMFNCCSGLISLDVSSFDTSNVNYFDRVFNSCSSLTSLNLSNFNTSNVVSMGWTFEACFGLTSLDISSFNTSKVTDMGGMFSRCYGLTSLDLSNFDTSNVTNMGYMFQRCLSLTSLNLGTFDMGKVTTSTNTFRGINPKVEITLAADSPSLTKIQTQLITDGVTGAKIHFNGKTYVYDTTTTSWKVA